MARHLITYDLKKNKDYPRLWAELRRLGACRPLLSVWVLKSQSTAAQLRDHFKGFVDSDDKLLVVELTGAWASNGLLSAENDCLRSLNS